MEKDIISIINRIIKSVETEEEAIEIFDIISIIISDASNYKCQ